MLSTVTSFTETCPRCGSPWEFRTGLLGKPASAFDSCAFRCLSCGIGFSNATNSKSRVRITVEPQLNVPPQARRGLADALAGAINVNNRPVKRQKFCSERSEDAVTWTVIAGLREVVGLRAHVAELRLGPPQALLLWGHPVDGERAVEVRDGLLAVSDDLGEKPDRRTEPDVIVLWPSLLVFVEAKHGSANDSQPDYAGYCTYLPALGRFSADDHTVRAEGSYQLTRNLGDGLGAGRDAGRLLHPRQSWPLRHRASCCGLRGSAAGEPESAIRASHLAAGAGLCSSPGVAG